MAPSLLASARPATQAPAHAAAGNARAAARCRALQSAPSALVGGRTSRRAARTIARNRRADSPIIGPAVQEGTPGYEQVLQMSDIMRRNRIIFLSGRINEDDATNVVASLLTLEAIDPKKEIKLYINSSGATAYAAVAIVDVMKQLSCPVSTVCMGMVGSTSGVILAAGTKGRRFAMPTSRIMIHQPFGYASGSTFEVKIQATELSRTMRVIHRFYADFTGQPLERIEEETDRDTYMSPEQAKEFGLIDHIVPMDPRKVPPGKSGPEPVYSGKLADSATWRKKEASTTQ
ncbi:unnamed protein product [Pedinophyceae sp. YPF-701]|nr:unnamed protein product [Pedinophyceae sp. YPF-701]